MNLLTRILLSYGLLLAFAVGGAVMAVVSGHRASDELRYAGIAHELHQHYLSLSNHAYQLFKQFGDATLIGDRDLGRGEQELLALLEADLTAIHEKIGLEVSLVGVEEMEEYDTLAAIDRLLGELITEHHAILALKKTGVPAVELGARLTHMHDEVIDKRFNTLIREAIAEEAREVEATKAASQRRLGLLDAWATAFVLVTVIASAGIVALLVRDTRRPLQHLLKGARAVAAGVAGYRIEPNGPREFAELAGAFNQMAGEVARREAAIALQNRDLERTVAQRTLELERALDALKMNESRRRQMLADVSHELRTPLTIIRGEADVALRGGCKEAAVYQEALERARSAAEHCARIVDDLLFIARQEANGARFQPERVDLATWLGQQVEDFGGLLESGGVRVALQTSLERAPASIDPVRIRQVLLILMDNAARYGGDRITVRLESLQSGYLVTVSDNGPGMNAQDQGQAFERFFRGTDAAVRYAHGTGLGLPVAKAIVEAHGGEITLRSEPANGVSVLFTLPIRPILDAVT